MESKLIADMKTYLGEDECACGDGVLFLCAKRAIGAFKAKRNYPSSFSKTRIGSDMENHYPCILDLSLFFFVKQGAEYEENHSEGGVSRSYQSETEIFVHYGVVSFARSVF